MPLQRCPNGHVYDTAKHGSCPICGAVPKRSPTDYPRAATLGKDQPVEAGGQRPATIGFYEERIGIEPVVGWLVCIAGPQRGRDYRIYAGTNSIGQSETMRISITGDKQISNINHAFLMFDPESSKFYILPGNAAGLAHHNRQLVNAATELRPFDEIKMGSTTLLFVPFVGEFGAPNFQWA